MRLRQLDAHCRRDPTVPLPQPNSHCRSNSTAPHRCQATEGTRLESSSPLRTLSRPISAIQDCLDPLRIRAVRQTLARRIKLQCHARQPDKPRPTAHHPSLRHQQTRSLQALHDSGRKREVDREPSTQAWPRSQPRNRTQQRTPAQPENDRRPTRRWTFDM